VLFYDSEVEQLVSTLMYPASVYNLCRCDTGKKHFIRGFNAFFRQEM